MSARGPHLPLSAEQRLVLRRQRETGVSEYFRVLGRVEAPGGPEAIAAAIRAAAAAHETLHMALADDGGESVLERRDDPLLQIETSAEARSGPDMRAWAAAAARAEAPPCARFLIAPAREGGGHWIHAEIPALFADRRSVAHLMAQIVSGSGPAGAPPIGYADYAALQRELPRSPEFEQAARFWSATRGTEGRPAGDPPACGAAGGAPIRIDVAIEQHLAQSLDRCGRAWNLSSRSILLAAWALLARRAGETRIALTVNAPDERLRELVGPMSRTLPANMPLDDGESLVSHCRAIEAAVRRMEEWDLFLPLMPEAGAADAVLDYLNAPARDASALFSVEEVPMEGAALRLLVREGEGTIEAVLFCRADRWDRAAAARLACLYPILLARICSEAADDARTLKRASEAEIAFLRDLASGPERLHPPVSAVDALERAFERFCDQAALVEGRKVLSYRELDDRTGRLADAIVRRLGPARGGIAVCMARSADAVCAVVAAMRAGCPFIPIEPDQPQERIDAILAQSGAALLVHDDGAAPSGAGIEGAEFTELLDSAQGAAGWVRAEPGDLAYIMHTSGSTGVPKGVRVTHANLAHYLDWALGHYFGGAPASMPLLTSLAFDLTITSLFCPLMSGGHIRVCPGEDAAADLVEAFGDPALGAIKLTPSHIDMLALLDCSCAQVALAIVGGEALHPAQVEVLRRLNPDMRIVNEYGPTEATVGCMAADIAEGAGTISIGRPISDTRIYILGDDLAPVAPGEIGEIVIGGAGVAQGYGRDVDAAEERFIRHALAAPGERLYRTGDLGRLTMTSEFEYLGRADTQVKIAGHRVELGEIESALRKLPRVAAAAALLRPDGSGRDRLVAFVAGDAGDEAELLLALGRSLPRHMVPQRIVALPDLPRTANQKIDRAALARRPIEPEAEGEDDDAAPLDPMLGRVVDLWSKVFARRVPAGASFQDLGGDSISAIRLVTLLNRELGCKIGIRDLYGRPSPRGMADYLRDLPGRAEEGFASPGLKGRAGFEPLDRPEVEEVLPASSISLGMIYQSLRDPALYHAQNVYDFHEPGLDREVFRESLAELVARHQALRSTFELSRYPEPVQIVWRDRPVALGFEDISSLDAAGRDEAIRNLLKEDMTHPFDPRGPLLWRATLVARGGGDFTFLWIHHHAILDGWSNALASAELAAIYRRRVAGEPEAQAPLEAKLADYAAEQKAIRADEEMRRFWRGELEGHRTLKLFDDPVAAPRVHVAERDLGAERFAGVRALARQLATDVRTICFAAYAISLSRYDYYKDFIVGLVENNRPLKPGADKLLGCFLNTVPVRLRWDRPPTGAEVVRLCHGKLLEMKHYGRLPLPDIANAAGRSGEAPVPLFETMFNFVDFSGQAAGWGSAAEDARSSPFSFERTETVLDCTVSITDGEFLCRYVGIARAAPDLAEQLAADFAATLDALIAGPEATVGLSGAEAPAGVSYAAGEAWPLQARGAHELFARAAARDPDAIAVVHGDVAVSYGALHAAAARLARHLRSKGVEPGDVVGLRLPRSIDYVSGMLGVMMAGGTFLALPLDYPPARLAGMVADAGCRWCIAAAEDASMPDLPGARTILLEAEGLSIACAAEGHAGGWPVEPDPERTAYIVYTSGSTGTPKGVPITHAGLVNAIQSVVRLFDVDSASRCLHFAALGFDMSIAEILRPLSAGARIVIASDADRDVDQLAKLCGKHSVTHVEMPPTMLKLMAAEDFPTLTHIVAGGEQCPDELGRRWSAAGRRFFNAYGPTETSIYASTEEMGPAPITIGRPLPNLSALILDVFGHPMPRTGVGELCVGGVGVTRGYIGRPELNRDRFVRFADGEAFAGRYYRTGDFARIGFDGRIRCYGRSDDQMSVHGQRIEPGEIEVALKAHGAIADAAVAARRVADADMLVAFVVPAANAAGEDFDGAAFRDHVARLLPRHMRPSLYVRVPGIPLTSSGKTDRRALSALELGAEPGQGRPEPAGDDFDRRVLALWQDILPLKKLGLGDDLFAAGGDSLSAIRIAARMNKEFGADISVEELVRAGSVARAAGLVRDRLSGAQSGLSPAAPAQSYPLSFAQRRLWVHGQRFGPRATPNLVSAYRLTGALKLDCVETALAALIRRHEVLRTRIAVLEGEPRQQILEPECVPVPLEHVAAGARDVAERIAAAPSLPFASDAAPLWRLFAYETGPDEWVIQFVLSHLICDAWSLEILVAGFAQAYAEACAGQASAVPPAAVQFKDYACWQRMRAEAAGNNAQAYWSTALAGASRAVDVPYDRVAQAGAPAPAASTERTIEGALFQRIVRRSAELQVSEYSLALTAAYLCLSEETGKDDLVLGAPMNGRSFDALSDQIGFYVNMVPLRLRPAAEPGAHALVRAVFSTVVSALSHQHHPLERIIAGVPGPAGGAGGMFDVGFDWTSVRDAGELPFDDLAIEALPGSVPEHETRLWFSGVRAADRIRLSLAYNSGRYSRARADEMLDRVVELLEQLAGQAGEGGETRPGGAAAASASAFDDRCAR